MDDLSSSRRRRRFRRHVQSEKEEESEGVDYLSNLPDELLRHILFFLPTLDSVRTSVLARRWRHLWTSFPVIDFDYLKIEPSSVLQRFFTSRGGDSFSYLRLSGHSIHREKRVRTGPMCYEYVNRELLVRHFVSYAKSHGVRHVTFLKFFYRQLGVFLFNMLFEWPSLESLNLQIVGCKNRTLFKFSRCYGAFRLSNLKVLSLALGENTIRKASLARLLSACPVLQELTLNAEYSQDKLIEIEAPNLLRLTLINAPSKLRIACQKLEYLRLKPPQFGFAHLHVEAPSLTCVRLYRIWHLETFAQTVCNVTAVSITVSDECLHLSGSTPIFHLLEQCKAVVQGFPIFHKLLALEIKILVAEKLSLDIVFGLLRCAPNLQSLVLTESKMQQARNEEYFVDEWESSSRRIDEQQQRLEHLQRVSVNIKSERIRSTFLNTLSDMVPAWNRVAVS